MKYETPTLEITTFDVRELGPSQNPGGGNFNCPSQGPDVDL